jgi:type I restriction enzyme R subunit
MHSFLDYVLTAYEVYGVDELAPGKIADFLRVRYGGTNDAKRKLGSVAEIKKAFVSIQRHPYEPVAPSG